MNLWIGTQEVSLNPEGPVTRMLYREGKLDTIQGDLLAEVTGLKKEEGIVYYHVSLPLGSIQESFRQQVSQEIEKQLHEPFLFTLCCTHTHYAPVLKDEPEYTQMIIQRLVQAMTHLEWTEYEEVRVRRVSRPFDKVGTGRISNQPSTVLAETITLSSKQKDLVTFMIYNSHPTTMSFKTPVISSAGPGLLLRNMKEKNPGASFTYMIGAAGDISTRFTRKEQTWQEVERLTAYLIEEMQEQIHGDTESVPMDEFGLEEKKLPVHRAYRDLSGLQLPEGMSDREKEMIEQAKVKDRQVDPSTLKGELFFQRLTLGPYHLIFTPFELFSEYLSCVNPTTTSLVNCSNDRVCYLSGANQKVLCFELFGESIAEDSKKDIYALLQKWGQ